MAALSVENGDQHLVRLALRNDLRQRGPIAQHLDPVNTPATLARVVVAELDRLAPAVLGRTVLLTPKSVGVMVEATTDYAVIWTLCA